MRGGCPTQAGARVTSYRIRTPGVAVPGAPVPAPFPALKAGEPAPGVADSAGDCAPPVPVPGPPGVALPAGVAVPAPGVAVPGPPGVAVPAGVAVPEEDMSKGLKCDSVAMTLSKPFVFDGVSVKPTHRWTQGHRTQQIP